MANKGFTWTFARGLMHDRAGFPEENIPKRTDWETIEDA